MKRLHTSLFFLVLVGLSACSEKHSDGGGGTNLQAVFKKTDAHVRDFAEQGLAAERNNDYSTAFRHYRALSLNPDLTQDQRNVANDSMLKMNARLREAADKGDKEAKQVLE